MPTFTLSICGFTISWHRAQPDPAAGPMYIAMYELDDVRLSRSPSGRHHVGLIAPTHTFDEFSARSALATARIGFREVKPVEFVYGRVHVMALPARARPRRTYATVADSWATRRAPGKKWPSMSDEVTRSTA